MTSEINRTSVSGYSCRFLGPATGEYPWGGRVLRRLSLEISGTLRALRGGTSSLRHGTRDHPRRSHRLRFRISRGMRVHDSPSIRGLPIKFRVMRMPLPHPLQCPPSTNTT